MSKYKIGDHVRVTTQDPYFDKYGPVVSLDGSGKFKFGVKLDDDAPLWFQEHELILADPEPHIEAVEHPAHYGGDTVYETIKVIHAWELGFSLGNAVKCISRAGKKNDAIEDLKKAAFYIADEIKKREAANE